MDLIKAKDIKWTEYDPAVDPLPILDMVHLAGFSYWVPRGEKCKTFGGWAKSTPEGKFRCGVHVDYRTHELPPCNTMKQAKRSLLGRLIEMGVVDPWRELR
jgi:hypothetical protein